MTNETTKMLKAYGNAPWLRALVQLVPGGAGSCVDVLISNKLTEINQKRVEGLFEDVSVQLEDLGEKKLNKQFLSSEEFIEIFRASVEIVARSADANKRKIISDYLAGIVRCENITDLSGQVLEDIRSLQPVHLQVLAILPSASDTKVDKAHPPEALDGMPAVVYEKCMNDLERFGFLRYSTEGVGTLNGGSGQWETTAYVKIFCEHVGSSSKEH